MVFENYEIQYVYSYKNAYFYICKPDNFDDVFYFDFMDDFNFITKSFTH